MTILQCLHINDEIDVKTDENSFLNYDQMHKEIHGQIIINIQQLSWLQPFIRELISFEVVDQIQWMQLLSVHGELNMNVGPNATVHVCSAIEYLLWRHTTRLT